MKSRLCFFICCTVCLLVMLLSSCRTHGLLSDDFYAGDTVTPEALLEISREIFTETEEPTTEPETESREPETLAPDATVYWLEGGSVYHADKACHHISHAEPENIKEGKISEAVACGKERLCSSCAP